MKDTPLLSNKSRNGHQARGPFVPLESLLQPAARTVNLVALREKLAAGRGPAFWRTIEEAAEGEDLREYIEQEFPALYAKYGALWKEGMHRANLFDAGLESTESFSAGGQRCRR